QAKLHALSPIPTTVVTHEPARWTRTSYDNSTTGAQRTFVRPLIPAVIIASTAQSVVQNGPPFAPFRTNRAGKPPSGSATPQSHGKRRASSNADCLHKQSSTGAPVSAKKSSSLLRVGASASKGGGSSSPQGSGPPLTQ